MHELEPNEESSCNSVHVFIRPLYNGKCTNSLWETSSGREKEGERERKREIEGASLWKTRKAQVKNVQLNVITFKHTHFSNSLATRKDLHLVGCPYVIILLRNCWNKRSFHWFCVVMGNVETTMYERFCLLNCLWVCVCVCEEMDASQLWHECA